MLETGSIEFFHCITCSPSGNEKIGCRFPSIFENASESGVICHNITHFLDIFKNRYIASALVHVWLGFHDLLASLFSVGYRGGVDSDGW